MASHQFNLLGVRLDGFVVELLRRFDPPASQIARVVGAGIAGLALASGVIRNGLSPVVVEIKAGTLPGGVGLQRWVNALLALRRLGLEDAAHAMPPFRGQGASMALENMVVLLHSFGQTSSIGDTLTLYERQRQPRVAQIRRIVQATGMISGHYAPPAQRVDDPHRHLDRAHRLTRTAITA